MVGGRQSGCRWDGIRVQVGKNPGVGGRQSGHGWEEIRVEAITGGKESGLRPRWEEIRVLLPTLGTLYPVFLPLRDTYTRFPSHRGDHGRFRMRPQDFRLKGTRSSSDWSLLKSALAQTPPHKRLCMEVIAS